MSKTRTFLDRAATPFLVFATLPRALWILTRGVRRAPRCGSGRLACASALLAALIPSLLQAQRPPEVLCYDVATAKPPLSETTRLNAALKALWLALDTEKGVEFRKKIEEAIREEQLEKRVGELLAKAYTELAMHKARTRGKGEDMKCYKMSSFGLAEMQSRERALKQLELLAQARKTGKVDPVTAEKARQALARELEILDPNGPIHEKQDVKAAQAGKVTPSPATLAAARKIVEWEGAPREKDK